MQLADREGFLIIDEILAVSLQFDNETNIAKRMRMCLQQIDELVARDKNHPGVVMWSVANEPQPKGLNLALTGSKSEDPSVLWGKTFLETLVRHARQIDQTRLVTVVSVMGRPNE